MVFCAFISTQFLRDINILPFTH